MLISQIWLNHFAGLAKEKMAAGCISVSGSICLPTYLYVSARACAGTCMQILVEHTLATSG